MANDKNFVIKNGLSVGTRYLQTGGTETAGTEGYALSEAVYDSVSFSVAGQDTSGLAITFKTDGTKMYMGGNTNDTIYQYSLSTAWDVSTASYDSVSFSVSAQEATIRDIVFNNDGTGMYIVGSTNDTVYQYTLSTAYDLSTASYASKSFSVSTQAAAPTGIAFNDTGTKLFVVDITTQNVFQYSLSTAYDISTASYTSVSFSVTSQESSPREVEFNSEGTKFFIVGTGNDTVYQYTLTTAYDLSTASYSGVSFSVATQDDNPQGLSFKMDGTKMYMIGTSLQSVFQYSTVSLTQTLDLSTGTTFSFTPSGATTVSFTNPPASGKAVGFAVEINGDGSAITWPSSVKWPSGVAPTATASKEVYAFVTTDGGTSYYGKLAGSDIA